MDGTLDILKAMLSLVNATGSAFGRILMQAGDFFKATFVNGSASYWLIGAIVVLATAAILAFYRSRKEIHEREEGTGYLVSFILVLTGFLLLTAGRIFADFIHPGQRAVWIMLTILTALHVLWFIGDRFFAKMKWERGSRYFRRIAVHRTAYYMILPTFILIGTFLYVPATTIFYYSFFQYDMGGTKELIGLGNYTRLVQDEIYWKSLRNMTIFMTLGIFFSLTVPLIVADLIFHLKTERMRYYLRAAFLVPVVVPGVIIYLIWGYLYSDAGAIPLFGHAIGLGDRLEGLLSRPQTAIYALVFVGFPFVMGINLLIYYAGLSNIDESVWEAAKMDGSGSVRRFFQIDIPLLARQVKLLLILGIIGGVQAFENVLVMTQGGPGWQTMLPGLYMYRSAMSFNEYGFACAIGVTLFLFVLILSLVVNRGAHGVDS